MVDLLLPESVAMKYTIFNPLGLRCAGLLKRLNMSIALLMLAGPVFAPQVTVDITPALHQ